MTPALTLREGTGELCARFARAESGCFAQWCALLGGRAKPGPAAVLASQAALHEAAVQLRAWCLAEPEQAEAERQGLMARQASGERAAAAAAGARRTADDRARIRGDWTAARWGIISQRDALTCGMGWPHRGELVTVSAWRPGPGGAQARVTGDGIYLNSCDVFNVGHQVWVPALSASHRKGTVAVSWQPVCSGPLGPADPAGDIGMRLRDAPGRRLPVPLMRWPGHGSGSSDAAAAPGPADQPALFGAAEIPGPPAGWRARPGRGPRGPRTAAAGPGETGQTLF